MTALLLKCTREEQRAVVHFLWVEGVKGVEIHKYLLSMEIICYISKVCIRMYSKVSRLAARSENCKLYSFLPLGAVVSLFCESV